MSNSATDTFPPNKFINLYIYIYIYIYIIFFLISPNAYIQYHYKTNATCYANGRITRPPGQERHLPLPL